MPSKPRRSKLYTRTGDRGETGLFGGSRVPKDHPRVVACGTIDELGAALGVAMSSIRQRTLVASLQKTLNDLFEIGAELSSGQPLPQGKRRGSTPGLHDAKTQRLEALIDEYDARLPALRTFVLPCGSSAASALHVARTICRRAERSVVTLARTETVHPAILAYLNRLSDLLFVLARYSNKAAHRREVRWRKDG
jgi:cob(I)alamin adenosyltransferase